MITECTYQNWLTAYVKPLRFESLDRHDVFSMLEKLERSEAKVLCYKIAYDSIFKSMIDEIEDIYNNQEGLRDAI